MVSNLSFLVEKRIDGANKTILLGWKGPSDHEKKRTFLTPWATCWKSNVEALELEFRRSTSYEVRMHMETIIC